MHITLRLICQILSRIAGEMSLLWGRKHGEQTAASFTQPVTLIHVYAYFYMCYTAKKCNVRLQYVKYALNERYITYVKRMD